MTNYRIVKHIEDGETVFSLCEDGGLRGIERRWLEIVTSDSLSGLLEHLGRMRHAFSQSVIDETENPDKSSNRPSYSTFRL